LKKNKNEKCCKKKVLKFWAIGSSHHHRMLGGFGGQLGGCRHHRLDGHQASLNFFLTFMYNKTASTLEKMSMSSFILRSVFVFVFFFYKCFIFLKEFCGLF
jgi:hypothetical protein